MMRETWRRLVHGSRCVWEHPDWPRFAGEDWSQRIMSVEVTDRFHAKQGRSIGRWTLTSGSRALTVYLKRHYRLPRALGWLATLFPQRSWSPGAREWQHLQWAEQASVPVPRALAAGEFVGPCGRLQSFLAVEELAGMLPLHEAIPLAARQLSPTQFARWKRGLVAEMVRVVRLLHDRHRFHQDLYLCHFYVARDDLQHGVDDWKGRVYLIDLHRLTRRRWTHAWGRSKDLAQLLYSARVEGVTARDCMRFWHVYARGRRWNWLRSLIIWKSQRYGNHNRKRQRTSAHARVSRSALEHRAVL